MVDEWTPWGIEDSGGTTFFVMLFFLYLGLMYYLGAVVSDREVCVSNLTNAADCRCIQPPPKIPPRPLFCCSCFIASLPANLSSVNETCSPNTAIPCTTICEFECEEGFTLSSNSSIVCIEGRLSNEIPVCIESMITVGSSPTTQQPASNLITQQPASISTTQQPASDSTTLQPTNNLTTQQTASTSTIQQPTSNSITQQPASNLTAQQPRSDSTTQQPRSDSTTQQPASKSTTQQPRSNSTTQQPRSNSTTQQTERISNTQQPAIKSTPQQRASNSTTQQPTGASTFSSRRTMEENQSSITTLPGTKAIDAGTAPFTTGNPTNSTQNMVITELLTTTHQPIGLTSNVTLSSEQTTTGSYGSTTARQGSGTMTETGESCLVPVENDPQTTCTANVTDGIACSFSCSRLDQNVEFICRRGMWEPQLASCSTLQIVAEVNMVNDVRRKRRDTLPSSNPTVLVIENTLENAVLSVPGVYSANVTTFTAENLTNGNIRGSYLTDVMYSKNQSLQNLTSIVRNAIHGIDDFDIFAIVAIIQYTCTPGICQNNGACRVDIDRMDFTCDCPEGYSGSRCEFAPDHEYLVPIFVPLFALLIAFTFVAVVIIVSCRIKFHLINGFRRRPFNRYDRRFHENIRRQEEDDMQQLYLTEDVDYYERFKKSDLGIRFSEELNARMQKRSRENSLGSNSHLVYRDRPQYKDEPGPSGTGNRKTNNGHLHTNYFARNELVNRQAKLHNGGQHNNEPPPLRKERGVTNTGRILNHQLPGNQPGYSLARTPNGGQQGINEHDPSKRGSEHRITKDQGTNIDQSARNQQEIRQIGMHDERQLGRDEPSPSWRDREPKGDETYKRNTNHSERNQSGNRRMETHDEGQHIREQSGSSGRERRVTNHEREIQTNHSARNESGNRQTDTVLDDTHTDNDQIHERPTEKSDERIVNCLQQ